MNEINKQICAWLLVSLSLALPAQNWNVFNSSYRYNYKYDGSPVISNVLFQDSVNLSGSDTIYYLNRVVTECTGACPGFSITFTPSAPGIITNMPQFLQRSLKKYSNGLVMLFDPFKLVIKPKCALNQSWLFDSIANYTATCTAIQLQTVFGIGDSVKTIVINASDTLRLSKSFGILSFPELYGTNKSYRLAGIEKRSSYDTTALYGLKVPNAWDFYNYRVGDVFCESYRSSLIAGPKFECRKTQFGIVSKTITPTGYSYKVNRYSTNQLSNMGSYTPVYCNDTLSYSSATLLLNNLNSVNLNENKMYPGMAVYASSITGLQDIYSPYAYQGYPNVAFLIKGSDGLYYKAMGQYGCGLKANTPTGKYGALSGGPNQSPMVLQPYYTGSSNAYLTSMIFAESYGLLYSHVSLFEVQSEYCKSGFIRNGQNVFGSLYVGLKEEEDQKDNLGIWPNPASASCNIRYSGLLSGKPLSVELFDASGRVILEQVFSAGQNHTLNTGVYPAGLYLLRITESGRLLGQSKLMIE